MTFSISGTSGLTFPDTTTMTTGAQAVKAWVNMNNTSGSSCVVRASYNVSSVTYVSLGVFTVNFTNAFSDANYASVTSSGVQGSTSTDGILGVSLANSTTYQSKTTTACTFRLILGNNSNYANNFDNNVAFFR
jgi:hypothetical protein